MQPGTVVDQYIIERSLASGGFSTVYLARQRSDQHQVAIKEYLPRRLAHRTWQNQVIPNDEASRKLFIRGRRLFFEEAKVLAGLRHPNIVEVLNFFQANATVYLVMTYDYGKVLSGYLQEKAGGLSEQFMLTVFPPLLGGIEVIHGRGLLHLDIKPQNILIRPGGDPLLLDFGAVQPYPYDGQAKLGTVLTSGFSPIEQCSDSGGLGPWSDIYAVGATMRMCLDGKSPPPAPERVDKDLLIPAVKAHKRKYPAYLLKAIDAAMAIRAEDRPQSAAALRDMLLEGQEKDLG
ncbi:serine/threonine protein kinase [Methylococcus sp. EFPC2]|uniref:serine/threonine protein kinase n=1 Tax=Methylococcus sp. EFPC2 TaxID=2812648 RepID=UPI0035303178